MAKSKKGKITILSSYIILNWLRKCKIYCVEARALDTVQTYGKLCLMGIWQPYTHTNIQGILNVLELQVGYRGT